MNINIIRSTYNFTLYIKFTHLPPLRAIGYNCCHPKKHIYNKIRGLKKIMVVYMVIND